MHLTKIHLLERQKRRHNRLEQFGLMQCKGTKPRVNRQPMGKPGWKPMAKPIDFGQFMGRVNDWLHFRRGRQRPPEKEDKI